VHFDVGAAWPRRVAGRSDGRLDDRIPQRRRSSR
jgi:hypothetical protein